MSAPLRVGVPAALAGLTPRSGHGRTWRSVLAALIRLGAQEGRVAISVVGDRGGSRLAALRPRREPVDVWLISGHEAPPPAVARSRAPAVAQLHEASWEDPELAGYLDPRMAAALRSGTAAALARAEHLITPSEFARAQVVRWLGVGADRVHAVLHGVDPAVFRPGAGDGAGRARVGAPYILYVGVVHPRKNLAALREAVTLLAGRGLPHVLALAAGPPADRDDPAGLIAAARAELPGAPGRLVWLGAGGEDGELAALMAGCAAFCLPSISEGFGLPALEAMACGAPVVISGAGALPEVVAGAGVIVGTPSPAALADALEGVVRDPSWAASLGAAARARAQTLTWERTARGWLAVLEQAAEAAEARARGR